MSSFDDEIRWQAHADGHFGGRIHAAWNIGNTPNGGYLMALAANALGQLAPAHPDPLSVTAHYLRPSQGGEDCRIDTQLLRAGKSVSTLRGSLGQAGKPRLEVLAAFGNLGADADAGTIAPVALPVPGLPPAEQCPERSGDSQGVLLHIQQRLEIRLHPQQAQAGAARVPVVSGWVRFRDGRDPDPLSLLLFADAFPPSLFGLLGPVGWVPTIELSVHVLRRPRPGWILGQFTTTSLANDRMVEDGALWDSSGQLVAQSRQLAVLLRKG